MPRGENRLTGRQAKLGTQIGYKLVTIYITLGAICHIADSYLISDKLVRTGNNAKAAFQPV